MSETHPGLSLLRGFLPKEEDRRLFVRLACEGEISSAWGIFYERQASNSPAPTKTEIETINSFIEYI